MNQPEQPVQPAQQPAIVVIYLTDSDSEDEPEEPLEDIPLPNQEDFWDNVEQESRLFHDSELEEGENNNPEQLPRPQEQRTGQSPLSDDRYAAFESWNPYWIETHYNPKHHRFWNPCNSAQSSKEEKILTTVNTQHRSQC
jgi:hypothetical protein